MKQIWWGQKYHAVFWKVESSYKEPEVHKANSYLEIIWESCFSFVGSMYSKIILKILNYGSHFKIYYEQKKPELVLAVQ